MRSRGRVIGAILERELAGYFSTPTGYVFISLFVFLSAMAAFWQERFFLNNLANLDQLNQFIPYLMVFFIPAISMSLWAEERKQGTDELLLTLPATDFEVVLGKFLAGVAIHTVALVFSLSHVVVLLWLGKPDPGLMFATYAGYWLMGVALLAVAMLASLATDNLTVAFILGAVGCSALVFMDRAGAILSGAPQRLAERLSLVQQFRDLASGVLTLSSLAYFLGLAAVALYLNAALLGKRRWRSGGGWRSPAPHIFIRAVSLLVVVGSLTLIASASRVRLDLTSEKLHSLAPETRALLRSLDPRQPVFIQAYISPEVPRAYVDARNNLVAMIREFEAAGGEAVRARIVETVKYSPQAREAQERFNIRPYRVPVTEESARATNEIFMGLAFTCGSEEFVIPFFDRGLPAEYELMRSIRVVSRAKRKKVGVLATPVRLFGGLDFQSRSQTQEWSVVAELRKQYEVVEVQPDAEYPEDIDVLLAAQPSELAPPQIARLTEYAKRGRPLLLLMDPLPAFNLELAPENANIRPLLDVLGVTWQMDRVVWDSYNPHPQLKSLPKEFVFVGKGFNPKEPVTAGLQEAVLIYPGVLRARSDAAARITPLMETSADSGLVRISDLIDRTPFGISLIRDVRRVPDDSKHMLAARVSGPVNAIVVADIDLMGEQFFELRRRGVANLTFDNVTFLLNAVDQLAGDSSFIELRKRRPRHRTLEAVEARTKEYEAQRLKETQQAELIAEQRLKEAQARLDREVREIEKRTDIDEQSKRIMIANVQAMENRRLSVARANIEDERQRQVEAARADMENSIRGIQNTIKLLAVTLPPVPAFVLFLIVSLRRLARERIGVSEDRLVEVRKS